MVRHAVVGGAARGRRGGRPRGRRGGRGCGGRGGSGAATGAMLYRDARRGDAQGVVFGAAESPLALVRVVEGRDVQRLHRQVRFQGFSAALPLDVSLVAAPKDAHAAVAVEDNGAAVRPLRNPFPPPLAHA
eukprot:6177267-Pyramimonas_sp.AAC.1